MNEILLVCSLLRMHKENFTRTEKINYIAKASKIDSNLIHGIIQVESRGNINAIGDRKLANKAYGLFQLRQPAISEVNKKFKLKHTIAEIRKDDTLQIMYCSLYLTILKTSLHEEKKYITAYNAGIGNVKKGFINNYYKKVKDAANEQITLDD